MLCLRVYSTVFLPNVNLHYITLVIIWPLETLHNSGAMVGVECCGSVAHRMLTQPLFDGPFNELVPH